MSGGAKASTRPAAAPPPSGTILPPLTRHLAFATMKPPFVPLDDYHRFSSPTTSRVPADRDTEAIVVRSPQLKRKSGLDDNGVGFSNHAGSPGCTTISNSPFRTPVSAKGGRTYSKSKASKGSGAGPQTPVSKADCASPLTPAGSCRYDSSLGLLTKRFVDLFKNADDGILDLNNAAETLEVQKRRIYDITNVLEGIGLIEKTLKNRIRWKGVDASRPVEGDATLLQAEIAKLTMDEHRLDDQIRDMQERLRDLSEEENNQKWLFVTEEDIKTLPYFLNETLIAIKAPHGTTLEVPDPDEAVDYPQRRYRIILRSSMGPIDVYLVSQFEENFEEMNNAEASVSIPHASSSGSHGNPMTEMTIGVGTQEGSDPLAQQVQTMFSDPNATQELGGMMKIVPSDVNNDSDYWLLSDADISITDMWKTDSNIEWTDFGVADVQTPRTENPSPGITEVPPGRENRRLPTEENTNIYQDRNDYTPLLKVGTRWKAADRLLDFMFKTAGAKLPMDLGVSRSEAWISSNVAHALEKDTARGGQPS